MRVTVSLGLGYGQCWISSSVGVGASVALGYRCSIRG